MNKWFAYKTLLVGLVAVGVSLVSFLGYSVFRPEGSVVAAAFQTPIPIAEPAPSLTVVKTGALELAGDLDADGIIDPGDTIKYTIVYSNTGVVTATNVTIVDDYDETLIASIPNISGEGVDDGETITWDLGPLAPGVGSSVFYESTLRDGFPPGSTPIENTAKIASDGVALASASKAVVVKRPRLTLLKERDLVKDANDDGTPDPGDTLKYTIYYDNTGEVGATQVTIEDDYDQNCVVNITNISEGGADDGDTITWDLGEVQPGESGSVTYEGTLGSLPVGATKVENAATISSAEMEPVTAKVSISVEVVPTQEPTAPPADQPLESFVKDPKYTVAFVVILAFGGIGGLIIATWRIPASAEAGNQRFLLIVEGITVCLILCTVIVLAFGQGIPTPAATSIISGVAGYVLGRSRAGVRPEELVKKKESAATEERPSPPPPTEPNA